MMIISKTKLEVSRTSFRQPLRDNVEHTYTEEYYGHSIFRHFLGSLLHQLNDRFQGKTKGAVKGMYLIPSNNKKLYE